VQCASSFPEAVVKNVKRYPAVPPGIEDVEAKMIERAKAAN